MSAYVANLVVIVGLNAAFALGLNIISGMCGQVSLGHAAFIGVGAYAAALLAKAGFTLWLTVPVAGAVAALLGVLVGLAALRVREDFLAITTMGVGFVFLGVVRKQGWLGAEMGISGIPEAGIPAGAFALVVLALVVLAVFASLQIARSWLGFSFAAIADDEDVTRLLGIDVTRHKLLAFAIGTLIAGLAGGLYAHYTRFVIPDAFGFVLSISALSMVVIGGVGSTFGVLIAAIALTLLPELFRVVNDYKLALYGALLLAVMRFAPDGLAGVTKRVVSRGST
ncbi:MAG: branched-chain amino acid ABC transporter permease [Burkholderiaceae bacterium]|nr:branched-chain amino acid ABC transporter permease [Burkholderiaceae bacterium]